jgi:NTE family protein
LPQGRGVSTSLAWAAATIFEGVPVEALESTLGQSRRRNFQPGTLLMREGRRLREMYILDSGTAEVSVADASGRPHEVNRLVRGDILGEMSLFTGRPASATVRALDEVWVIVVSEAELHHLAERFPRVYQNLGAIVSRKLYRADRLRLRKPHSRTLELHPRHSESLTGYALAASVAWHTRAPVLLLDFAREDQSQTARDAGTTLSSFCYCPGLDTWPAAARAHFLRVLPEDSFSPERLLASVERLNETFGYVFVQGIEGTGLPIRELASVGPLSATDAEALETGLLSHASNVGRTVGAMAREIAGLRVGVALGAGGMKGFAHVGVLAALEDAGVPCDFLAGCSIGSLVAALYASGYRTAEIADVLQRGGAVGVRPVFSVRSLFSDAPLRRFGRTLLGTARIEDLSPPVAIVAADILSGDEVVFRRGPAVPALIASCAIPGILPAQRIGDRLLVDGGVVDPVPSSVVADMGADVVLAVNLRGQSGSRRIEATADESSGRPPAVVEVISRTLDLMQSHVAPPQSESTITIEPRCAGAASWDLRGFSKGVRYVSDGADAVLHVLPRVAAALPWVDATHIRAS